MDIEGGMGKGFKNVPMKAKKAKVNPPVFLAKGKKPPKSTIWQDKRFVKKVRISKISIGLPTFFQLFPARFACLFARH